MSQKTRDILFQVFPVIILAILSLVAIIFAWTEPTQAPPGGNVPAPLHTGPAGQVKIGGLILNTGGAPIGLIVDKGNVGIGTTTPPAKLYVRTTDTTTTPFQVEALVGGSSSSSGWLSGWLSGWSYRRAITISNPTSTLTDFQVLITLNTASLIAAEKMRTDCGDMIFTDSDGSTILPHFLESGCNSTSTKIWKRIPSIPPGTKTIYVYYGNPSVVFASQLWHNVKHLRIFHGVFNYNAALGVGGFHSREMQHRVGVAAEGGHTCVLLTNGNIDCWGNNAYGQAADYTGGNAIGVAPGWNHTCALLTNGNVDCWGQNNHGQAADYTGGNAIGVDAGWNHTCALLTNGNIDCWGNNEFGQAADYTGGNAIGVAGGGLHTCILLTNGNIDCRGNNGYGQAADYTGGNAIGVAAGGYHTCALLSNGNIDCWGNNEFGQAADYTGGNAIGVAAGYWHTCTLLSNGNVSCWGWNPYGQTAGYFKGNAIGVTTGGHHTCALLTNGNVDCWGLNDNGQAADYLGENARNPFRKYVSPAPTTTVGPEESFPPPVPPGPTTVFYIQPQTGNIGIKTTTPLEKLDVAGAIRIGDTPSPCDASRRGVIKFISGTPGTADCLAVCKRRADGTFAWTCIDVAAGPGGLAFKYRRPITISNPTSTLTDYQISITLDTASLIAANKIRADCGDIRITDSDGSTFLPYSLGRGECNSTSTQIWSKVPSLPTGTKTIYLYYGLPLLPAGDQLWYNVKHLNLLEGVFNYNASLGVGGYHSREMQHRLGGAGGYYHTCALLPNGNIDCWGSNEYGQAADYLGGNAIEVAGGWEHTCALLTNGNIDCWGGNSNGQAADYTKGDAIGVSTSRTHTCALLTNGNIDCWGGNTYGQAADYTKGDAIGVDVGLWFTCALLTNGNIDCWGGYNGTDYTKGDAIGVSAGAVHTCALLSNGNIDCWGCSYYNFGQCNDYTGRNAIGVFAGKYHTCALLTNGNIHCWGHNADGQAVDYTKGNAIGVAPGAFHTCALLTNGNIDCWGRNDYGQAADYTKGDARNPFRKYVSPAPTTSVGAEETLY